MSTHPNSGSSASTAAKSETKSHELLKAHTFPVGSIGKEGGSAPWKTKAESDRYSILKDEQDNTYARLLSGLELWQDFKIHVPANPGSEGRPEYLVGCQYDTSSIEGCRIQVFLVKDGDIQLPVLLDEALGDQKMEVTWHTFDIQRIRVDRDGTHLRVNFMIPEDGNKEVYLRNVVTALRLPPLDNVGRGIASR
ncbi:hypothetical protein [Pseudomonas entomophila]|uniref:hypothetical protein n=1 Tax=Pseudomonas entomophila TaxID=312306 RepID=UPI001EFFB6BC|nr:hypothetical protein [Pseudomonas entomophila]MCG8296087.1 hypothetical protein [Pseudomonas entomophila]